MLNMRMRRKRAKTPVRLHNQPAECEE